MTKTIIETLEDPHLFGGMFDHPSWRPWIVFLRALFALPMDEAALSTYRHHTARQKPPTSPSRYATLVCGRRGGKSRILALVAVFMACILEHDAYVAPGESPVIAIIAADRKQARVILGYITGFLKAIPLLAPMIESELTESVRLTNGVTIEIHTAAVGAPRGRTFLAILADEIAFWPMGDSANPDAEIINAVRPGLSTIPYSLLLIASSPYARRGVLYSNYAKHFGKDEAPALVWQGSTQEMNATLADDPLIAEMYQDDFERASAEFGAQFRTDVADFITREAVEAVVAPGLVEIPPVSGTAYAGHVDPSGGSADSFTLAIAHLDADGVAVLDLVREVRPPFAPDTVVEDFATILNAYGLSRVAGDAYSGEWCRERFALHGISYDVAPKNTSALYGELLPALNGRRVQLLDLPRLTAQLVGLERRTARGGKDSISHGPGGHDDVANAVAGALVQVISDKRPTLIREIDLHNPKSPLPMPRRADELFAVLQVDLNGTAAVVYASHAQFVPPGTAPVHILDFAAGPWSNKTLQDIYCRIEELMNTIPHTGAGVYLPSAFLEHAELAGYQAIEIPKKLLLNQDHLSLGAAAAASDGLVKLTGLAAEKARSHPLGGALQFRAGDKMDADPLRHAALLAIACCFTPN